jgi:carbonic anhydrase
MRSNLPADEALERLLTGNQRFRNSIRSTDSLLGARREELIEDQHPFAIVLGCADSRVPAEIVFDQGLGDLFVIRVAGNIVAPSGIGSVEFAAERFGTRLVLVLGHSRCGAVQATLESILDPHAEPPSENLHSIVRRVRPAVEPLLATDLRKDRTALLREAVRANVRASVAQLRSSSSLLERLIEREGFAVAGGEYKLETGEVELIEPPG